jgi:hypothetical protein
MFTALFQSTPLREGRPFAREPTSGIDSEMLFREQVTITAKKYVVLSKRSTTY